MKTENSSVLQIATDASAQDQKIRVPYRQRGMTLLEGLAWMAIAGLVVAGALAMNAKGWLGNKEQKEMTHISAIISGAKQLQTVTGYGTAGTSLVAAMINGGLVPSDMTVSGSTIVNRYGATVTVVSTGLGYTVTDPGLPASACMSLVTGISAMGDISTKMNSGTATTGPIAAAAASAGCNTASNTVAFTLAN